MEEECSRCKLEVEEVEDNNDVEGTREELPFEFEFEVEVEEEEGVAEDLRAELPRRSGRDGDCCCD
jgi:hypothetical protein